MYNILKDIYFYIWVVVFIVSAIVFIDSIRRLFMLKKTDKVVSENDDIAVDELSDAVYSKDEETIKVEEGNVIVEKRKKDENKIEFEKTDELSLFNKDEVKKDEEKKEESFSAAVRYIIELNENIDEIKQGLSKLKDINEKITGIEEKLKLNDEILNKINLIEVKKVSLDESSSSNKLAPRYIYKYIEDIVEDYENIDKEMIKKRLLIILSELNKIEKDGG